MSINQMMLGEESGEAVIPNAGSLTQAVERLLQMTDMSRKNWIFKVRRLKHVELLVECPMKKSGANVELSKIVIFNSHNGQKGADALKLSNRTESFSIINPITLSKAACDKASLKPVNVSSRITFDPVGPLATDSCSGGR